MVRIAGGADVARGSELARSAARLLTNAPDVAYSVTPETGGWREGCLRAARRRGVGGIVELRRSARRAARRRWVGGSVELRRLLWAVR